jgi:hypothetical protein
MRDSRTPGDQQAAGSRRAPILAALIYIILTLVAAAPLLARLSTTVPHDPGDPVLNAWILWWNATAVPLTASWWNGLGFYPLESTVAFSEHLLGFAWLTSPLIWMGATPAAAHNVAFVASFPLSALAAYALAWQVTRRHDAAFLAGLCFGFHPFRMAHLSHVQVLASFWMPLALLGLHRFFDSGDRRWLALFGVSWLLQSLSNNYYLLYFSVLVGAWLVWFGLQRGKLRLLAEALAAWAIAIACLTPIVYVYLRTHRAYGLKRSFEEIAAFSADLSSFLNPSSLLAVWGWARFDSRVEHELFIGLTAAITIAFGVAWRLRAGVAIAPAAGGVWRRRIVPAAAGIGLALILAAIWAWLDAAGRSPIPSFGMRRPEKSFTLGLAALGIALALHRPVRDALRRRSVFAFYTLATLGALACSLGPEGLLFGTKVLYRTPYGYLMEWIPGFDGVRVPARFLMIATLGLAIALALAFARLVPLGHRRRLALAGAVTVGLLCDGAIRALPVAPAPAPAPSLAGIGPGVVLELPIAGVYEDAGALYRSSLHRRRLINGYSGYESLFYAAVSNGLAVEDSKVLDELTAASPVIVLVDRARDPDGRWAQFVERAANVERFGPSAGFERYRLPRRARETEPPGCCAIPIRAVTADSGADRASRILDHDIATVWATDGSQQAGNALVADLGASQRVAWFELHQGRWPGDTPFALEVAVSDDGQTWNHVWAGVTAPATMRAVLRDPRLVVLRFTLPAVAPARFVRLRQTADGALRRWTLAELRIGGSR